MKKNNNQNLKKNDFENIDTIKFYLSEIKNIPFLTCSQEIELSMKIKNGDKKAKNNFIVSNLNLVIIIAKRYLKYNIPLLDLIEEGNIGLIKAVEKFDAKKGYRFNTFASLLIKQAMIKCIIEQGKIIKIPLHISTKLFKYFKFIQNYLQVKGREPSKEEIANQMKLKEKDIEIISSLFQFPISLESKNDNNQEFINFVKDDNYSKSDPFNKIELLVALINKLSKQEQFVIQHRYGLNGYEASTLRGIGEMMGLTKERIRQIENKSLEKLYISFQKEKDN
ncbi:MAG: RNA polymerase sigma factor RpoD/SigA [bacterium]